MNLFDEMIQQGHLLELFLGAALILGLLTVYSLWRSFHGRLKRLTEAVEEIGRTGNPSRIVIVAGRDDLARLANAINRSLVVLHASEEKYRELVETINDTIFMYDDQGRLTYISPVIEQRSDYTSSELIGHPISDFIHPDDLPAILEMMRRRRSGDSEPIEFRIVTRSQGVYWVRSSSRPVFDGDRLIGFRGVMSNITAQKQAEEALRRSEQRYRSLFDRVPVGLYRTTPAGDIIDANPALLQLMGFADRQLMLALPVSKLWVHPEDRAAWRERVEREEVVRGLELEWRRADGLAIWVRESVRVVRDEGGNVICYEGSVEDITEQRQASEALRKTETKYRELVENINDIIFTLNPDGRITYISPVVEQRLGYRPDEVIGHPLTKFVSPEDANTVDESLQQRLAGVQSNPFDFQVVTRRGDVRWVCCSSRLAIREEQQHILDGVLADVTESRMALEAMLESEQRLDLALHSAELGLWDWNIQRDDIIIDERFAEMIGYSREELLSTDWFMDALYHPSDRPNVERARQDHFSGKTPYFESEHRLQTKTGEWRWILARGKVVERDGGGQPLRMVGTNLDVTERRWMERQLAQKQKMEALGNFASGIAHDFNNLVMVISGSIELLRRRVTPDCLLLDEIEIVQRATRQATDLTRSLLAFARRQILRREDIALAPLIQEMLPMLQRVMPENISIHFTPAETPVWVLADPGQVEQVLMNISLNARDAMPDGGGISIASGMAELDPAYVEAHPWAKPGTYSYISVSDTGVGMDKQTLARIFEPFFSTKELGKGTGLGLATVYGIVKQHGGVIDVSSKPGAGTTFTVYLPRGEARVRPAARAVEKMAAGGGESILVVEDNPDLRKLICRFLEELGYHHRQAKDGAEAWQILQDGPVDLIMTDLIMPVMGGIDLYVKCREHDSGRVSAPAFLLTSGYSETDEVLNYPDDRRLGFIAKPYDLDRLAHAIRGLLDEERG